MDDDRNLAAAAARGDQEAFTALVMRYRRYIYTIAHKIALHEEDALDISQNVLLRLAERMNQYDGRGAFRSWLATMTAREALDHRRRTSRRAIGVDPETLVGLAEQHRPGTPDHPRNRFAATEQRKQVEEAMGTLSAQQRAIFALYLGEEMRPVEIAGQLGVPARQVRVQLHRGIQKIRQVLCEDSEAPERRSSSQSLQENLNPMQESDR